LYTTPTVVNVSMKEMSTQTIMDGKTVFWAPKVYGIEDENGKTIIKIKGETSKSIEVMKNNNN